MQTIKLQLSTPDAMHETGLCFTPQEMTYNPHQHVPQHTLQIPAPLILINFQSYSTQTDKAEQWKSFLAHTSSVFRDLSSKHFVRNDRTWGG